MPHFARPLVFLLALLLFGLSDYAEAQRRSPSRSRSTTSASSGKVRVRGYYRKDGTYVAPHTRSAPRTSRPSYTYRAPAPTPKLRTPPSASRTRPADAYGVQRDPRGRIKRSTSAHNGFMRSTGYPNGRHGYVVDHITPLACGGQDTAENMQWLTIEQWKQKSKWERKGCE